MAKNISSRTYRDGDELLINDLYRRVTGRERSESQYQWQWQMSPAGPGFIYLIEHQNHDDQEPLLIGHHGIMPIRFSRGSDDWVAGKTENTMVDPVYRSNLIYPRFESRFKQKYSANFNVLFSTMGSKDAIRQRLAHGYQEVGEWKILMLSACRALFRLNVVSASNRSLLKDFELIPLDSKALTNIPFKSFWQNAKGGYPLTTSRLPEDIQWRFVDNPYHDYLLGVLWMKADKEKIRGYVVIRCADEERSMPIIEDIVTVNPSADEFTLLLCVTLHSLLLKGFYWSSLPFVVDNSTVSNELFKGAMPFVSSLSEIKDSVKSAMRRRVTEKPRGMMRWINPNNIDQARIDEWYITGMVFEGR